MTTSERRFDPDAHREEHDYLKEPDEGVDGKPCEGARLGPAGDGAIETTLHDRVELNMLPHDQADRRREDHHAAKDVAENWLARAPDWIGDGATQDERYENREEDPAPVEPGHGLLLSANWRLHALDRESPSRHRPSDFRVERGIHRHQGHPAPVRNGRTCSYRL